MAVATTPEPTAVRGTPGRHSRAVGAALGVGLGVVAFWLMHRTLGDDALISVSYARTLAESGTWGVAPGLTSNTQTSPLNVWLLAAGIAVAGHPIVVVGVLACACLGLCGWLATDVAHRLGVHPAGGWLTVALLGTSPVLVSTIGLETFVGVTVLFALAATALRGLAVPTGLLCGLAVLTRPDLAVAAAALALLLAAAPDLAGGRPPRRSTLPVVVGVAALVALPWHVWSWFVLGDAVPDTTWVRTADTSGPEIFAAIPGWVERYPLAGTTSVLLVLAGTACAVGALFRGGDRPWARTVVVVAGAGWLYLLMMQLIRAQGADWYYGPAVACAAMAVGLTAASGGSLVPRVGVVVVGVAALAGVFLGGPVPWTWAPLVANLARTEQYADIARQLPALTGGEPVRGTGELGALAFYGAPVPILDQLSEPAQTEVIMRDRAAAAGPVRRTLMAWSTAHRRPSTPYPVRWQLTYGHAGTPEGARVVRIWPIDTPIFGSDTIVLSERTPATGPPS